MRYPKQGSLRKYYDDIVVDKVHNAMKHGDYKSLKKYEVYLKPMGRASNGHKTRLYRTA